MATAAKRTGPHKPLARVCVSAHTLSPPRSTKEGWCDFTRTDVVFILTPGLETEKHMPSKVVLCILIYAKALSKDMLFLFLTL